MSSSKKIKRLLIANRGEICRRIAITAKRLGIECVAIKESGQPIKSFLNGLIDHWIEVNSETTSTYLDMDFLILQAQKLECDAIHPGFGFLSENADFAARVQYSGIKWVGPTPESIRMMASKSEASKIAEKCGVPIVPGIKKLEIPEDEKGDFSEIEAFVEKNGFPILLKAAYGGGGKGMRRVTEHSALKAAAIRAKSEAKASFGNGELICEKYIETARHVEVQVLADLHGNVRILFDRDCSVQRRHQKIIEEAPAPLLDDSTRKAMHLAAGNLCKEVGYLNAGTVEFILEWDPKNRRCMDFYFLEMNTRLQVEHPVTEEILGMDLVEWQFRVAAGESIAQIPVDFTLQCHAIEARIYAENPDNDFFPSPGPVNLFVPKQKECLRWELGVDSVDNVSDRFDPMISKLISTGKNRDEAIANLEFGLKKTHLICASNNISFLLKTLSTETFRKVSMTTRWIDTKPEELFKPEDEKSMAPTKQHAQALAEHSFQLSEFSVDQSHKTSALSKRCFSDSLKYEYIRRPGNGVRKVFSGSEQIDTYSYTGNTTIPDAEVAISRTPAGNFASVLIEHQRFSFCDRPYYLGKFQEMNQDEGGFLAPVPGKVIKILKHESDQVEKNEVVFVLESMKMEFEVRAENSGKIGTLNVSEGEQVASGQALASMEEN